MANIHCETFIIAWVYINRVLESGKCTITPLTQHRVVLAAVMVGAKYFEECFLTNRICAKILSLSLEEFNALEISFLDALEWRMYVSEGEYEEARTLLTVMGIMEYLTLRSIIGDN
eukprot:GHVO01006468.1.p1 GENE.GHVO01006468.1~~GHVO01006468.1.p1  ORF type:complete len:132 (+),score=16.70 GHVO01006468.1:50-397(+)